MLVPVGIDHGGDPHFALREPLLDGARVGVPDEVVGEEIRHLHGHPLSRMVATHEEHLASAAPALADPQGPDRAVLHAPPDLVQLCDLGVRLGELA